MTIDEIMRIDPRDGIALLQWSYPLYLRKVGWTELPQAKRNQEMRYAAVEEVIPARGFKISLPEIEVEGKDYPPAFLNKTETGQKPVINDDSVADVQSVVPW